MSKISRMSETMGGFVVTSNLYKTYTENGVEVPEATITVRVPAEKLAAALDEIKGLVKDPDQDILYRKRQRPGCDCRIYRLEFALEEPERNRSPAARNYGLRGQDGRCSGSQPGAYPGARTDRGPGRAD